MPRRAAATAGWTSSPLTIARGDLDARSPAQHSLEVVRAHEVLGTPLERETSVDKMAQSDRDALRQMLLDRSMKFGEFVLSSGATSHYYIDVRKTSLHPAGLKMITRLFWEQLEEDGVTAIGGLTMGADPLVAGLMWWSLEAGKPLEGFLVRKNPKDHGMRGSVEGNLAGHKRVAILDDVITSGESALIACEAAESYKAEVVRVLAVVDRAQGAPQIFQQRGYNYTSLFAIGDLLPAEK